MSEYVRYLKEYDPFSGSLTDILNNTGIKPLYDNIIEYYNGTGQKYKPADIFEYNEIFEKCRRIGGMTLKTLNVGWLDCRNFVTVIMEDGSEVPFNENVSKKSAMLFRLKLSENIQLTLHKNVILDTKNMYKWTSDSDKYYEMPYDGSATVSLEFDTDLNGYANTYRNINIWDGEKNDFSIYPAFEYVNNINEMSGYKAYLPAKDEMKWAVYFVNVIQYVSLKLTEKFVARKYLENALTSSEYAKMWAVATVDKSKHNKYYFECSKSNSYYIIPMFKKLSI